MKRDMDLVREILIEVEKQPVNQPWLAVPLLGYSSAEVGYHVVLARDAGLVDARIGAAGSGVVVMRLTNDGHAFVEAARSNTVWEKAKEMVTKATGTLTLQAISLALPKVIEHLMKS